MAKKVKTYEVSTTHCSKYSSYIEHSDFTKLGATEVVQAVLNADTADNLKDILSKDYVYDPCISQWDNNSEDMKCETKFNGKWYYCNYEEYYARPIVEFLFFDKPDVFKQLLQHIANNNREDLYIALIDSMQGTDLSSPGLLCWDSKTEDLLNHNLKNLDNYGLKLYQQQEPKGDAILNIVQELKTLLASPSTIHYEDPAYKTVLNTLQKKVDLIQTLHRSDNELNQHRGYACIVSNIVSILLTGGLANLVKKIFTGHWAFFDKTASQERVDQLQHDLGLNTDEGIMPSLS